MKVKFSDIKNIYEGEISLGIKNKKILYNFERNKMQNLTDIYFSLLNNNYGVEHYNIFLIREPKKRIVMSLNVRDKIINHYATKHILIPRLDKYLDMRNVATRKGLGSDYGIKLIKKYLEDCLIKIIDKITNYYKLKVNKNKTQISNVKDGFIFLDYKFKVINHKTIVKIRQDTLKKVVKRIREVNYLYDSNKIEFNSYFASIANYQFSWKYANSYKVKRCINEYF